MFGRKKKPVDDEEPLDEIVDDETDEDDGDESGDEPDEDELDEDELGDDSDDEDESDDEEDEDSAEDDDETESSLEEEELEEEEAEPEPVDEWEALDAAQDWREDGPFDISEVDLEADDVQRLDFGSLVVTPFDGMQMQMQVNQASNQVQALLVVDKDSAIEVALFAAPLHSSMLAEVRADMRVATEKAGGKMTLAEGPLGTEIHRDLPVKGPDGRQGHQPSRTWLVQGPKWLLRGVLMGQAALSDDLESDEAEMLFEFFCNLVVRRGDTPHVPGELIALDIPAAVLADMQKQAEKQKPADKK